MGQWSWVPMGPTSPEKEEGSLSLRKPERWDWNTRSELKSAQNGAFKLDPRGGGRGGWNGVTYQRPATFRILEPQNEVATRRRRK